MSLLKCARYLFKVVPFVEKVCLHKDMIVLKVRSSKILEVLSFLKNHSNLRMELLLDVWAVDYPNNNKRFEVNYLLCSVVYNFRVVVRVVLEDSQGLNSVESLFPSSGWLEREVWDMYGIIFYKNKDLRRILTDYGFEGHPLRKDFPLSGYVEVRYDDAEKRVLQEPLEVSQEYRAFDFKSPWEN